MPSPIKQQVHDVQMPCGDCGSPGQPPLPPGPGWRDKGTRSPTWLKGAVKSTHVGVKVASWNLDLLLTSCRTLVRRLKLCARVSHF